MTTLVMQDFTPAKRYYRARLPGGRVQEFSANDDDHAYEIIAIAFGIYAAENMELEQIEKETDV